ncbi:MAG: hypothetical protein V1850_07825 [Candidatus Bathyarchaeota archaeon]
MKTPKYFPKIIFILVTGIVRSTSRVLRSFSPAMVSVAKLAPAATEKMPMKYGIREPAVT